MINRQPLTAKNLSNQGFTLIELIIYLGIVSIILVSISYLMIDILGGQSKNYANQDVNQNLRFITTQITKDIKSAQVISSLSSDQLVLDMPGDDITYLFTPASSTLTRQIGLEPPINVASNRMNVTGDFTDLSYLTRTTNVSINLAVSYKNPNNLPDFNASSSAVWSVELRGRK